MQLLIKDAGFTTIDAIIAATRNSACALDLGARKGLVKVNMDADLLIVDANPR